MYRTRDWRRSQQQRYINKGIQKAKSVNSDCYIPNAINLFSCWIDTIGNTRGFHTWKDVFDYRYQKARFLVDNRTKCSCQICGNPRKWFNTKTRQEQRFELNCKDLK